MWQRSKLKERAKATFLKVYWKAVLVSFIAFIFTGGIGEVSSNVTDARDIYNGTYMESSTEESSYFYNEIEYLYENIFEDNAILLFVSVITTTLVVILLIKALVYYPITIGKNNYFMGIRKEDKPVKTILFAYKSGKLKNTVIVMLMMDIFIYLWSLLLLIPGVIKSYEYRMIPYILSENPSINRKRAFEISKKMMYGNKWSVLELDLSFIGWYLLSVLTLGLVSIFYVNPYIESTNAELYAYLREVALEKGYAEESELIGF